MVESGELTMWWSQVLLAIIGLSSGIVVAGGLFSLIIGLGIVSNLADRTKTGDSVMRYENAIALGGIVGSSLFLFHPQISFLSWLLPIFGLASGFFVGCWAMSLAEVINIFPITIRRVKLVRGVKYITACLAIGKCIGALILFGQGWGK